MPECNIVLADASWPELSKAYPLSTMGFSWSTTIYHGLPRIIKREDSLTFSTVLDGRSW